MDEKTGSVGNTSAAPAAEQLRAGLADTRAQMGETIEALHGRLNPTVLKEQAMESFHEMKDSVTSELKDQFNEAKAALKTELATEIAEVKHKVSDEIDEAKAAMRAATIGKVENMVHTAQDKVMETGTSMLDTIKANPIPVALVGAGLTWLFIRGRKPSRGRSMQSPMASQQVGGAIGSAAHQVGDFATDSGHKIANVTHQAVDAVGNAAHVAAEKGNQIVHQVSDKSVELARVTRDGMQRMQQRTAMAFRNTPLAFGAAALAIGTAIGLAIPSSRKEDSLMGEARDDLFGKAETLAHEAIDKVGDVAKHLVAGEGDEGDNDEERGSQDRSMRGAGGGKSNKPQKRAKNAPESQETQRDDDRMGSGGHGVPNGSRTPHNYSNS